MTDVDDVGSPDLVIDPPPPAFPSPAAAPLSGELASLRGTYLDGFTRGITAGYAEGVIERAANRSEAVSSAYGRGKRAAADEFAPQLSDRVTLVLCAIAAGALAGAKLRERWLFTHGELIERPNAIVVDVDQVPRDV